MLRDYGVLLKNERPIEPCPPGMREEVRRALLGKLAELELEINNCRRRALEGGFACTEWRLARLKGKVTPIVDALRKEVVG